MPTGKEGGEGGWNRLYIIFGALASLAIILGFLIDRTGILPRTWNTGDQAGQEVKGAVPVLGGVPDAPTPVRQILMPTNTLVPSPLPVSTLAPSPLPSSTPLVPTAIPTNTPPPVHDQVLYQANWSKDFDGWAGDESWKVLNGMLLNDGTNARATIRAPYEPGKSGVADYAVEVEIQTIGNLCGTFGIIVRTGYYGGIEFTSCPDDSNSFAMIGTTFPDYWNGKISQINYYPDKNWHLYRLEVQGNESKLFIDKRPMVQVQDNRFLDGGDVSLWSDRAQLSFRNLKVIAQ